MLNLFLSLYFLVASNFSSTFVNNAEQFIGTPYDFLPEGLYVKNKAIIADQKIDCLYLIFRSYELTATKLHYYKNAEEAALHLRFQHLGKIKNGRVLNYDDRYQYAEDLLSSGKLGIDVSAKIGKLTKIPGSRQYREFSFLSKREILKKINKLENGLIILFVKDPKKRSPMQEIIGHLGIITVHNNKRYLLHASSQKKYNAQVAEVDFGEYLKESHFIGAVFIKPEPPRILD